MTGVENITVLGLGDKELVKLSKKMMLSLNRDEMVRIQNYFMGRDRNPTDAELEMIAQTWSEHCKHKVMNAEINYVEVEGGKEVKNELVDSLFKSYIKKATDEIGARKPNFLISV
ncbi:phosphoribosylformylglycinamidine synthase subunit PurL, partial [Candidatus Micrarchaeota archaeon]|nr:phosphoribosylformylglycinamidine synthase subunit PurL [Candidatus Micrarchaeota archaeon]